MVSILTKERWYLIIFLSLLPLIYLIHLNAFYHHPYLPIVLPTRYCWTLSFIFVHVCNTYSLNSLVELVHVITHLNSCFLPYHPSSSSWSHSPVRRVYISTSINVLLFIYILSLSYKKYHVIFRLVFFYLFHLIGSQRVVHLF